MDENILDIYRTHPMRDGDVALLLLEQHLVTEVEDLANRWDPVVRRNLAKTLRELDVREVQVAIARATGELEPRDQALVGSLREELAGSGIVVHPPIPLPAAA